MTGSPIRLPSRRETRQLKTPTTPCSTEPKQPKPFSISLPLTTMRRRAPPSRPYGRYAVGLRPSLDSDAYFDAPSQDQEAPKTRKNKPSRGLDRPRSFRNDLRKF